MPSQSDVRLRPKGLGAEESGEIVSVNPQRAGWRYLSFDVHRLQPGETLSLSAGEAETALVVLTGRCDVESTRGSWTGLGGRPSVFAGKPWTLYLPCRTAYAVRALEGPVEFALCSALAEREFPPRVIEPDEVQVEVRGGRNVTRLIHHIIPPDFPAHRLLVCEVFTPSGNWSSYPPHKHDRADMPREAALEEVYFYRISHPDGFALQRLYTDDRQLDETLTLTDNDLVLVREGYHPVAAAPGYHCYYLNVLAGEERTMQAADDPHHAWVRGPWAPRDDGSPLGRLIGGGGPTA